MSDTTIMGTPASISFTEDTAGNLDLSAITLADPDAGNVTITLTVNEGTFGTPANGSGVGAGVTATRVSATQVTLVGTVADINTYLNTASNITWTPAANDEGNGASTLTITATDGDGTNTLASNLPLNVTGVNDAPTSTDKTVTSLEGSNRTLTVSDFNFSDVDQSGNNSLQSVRIDSFTAAGALRLNDVPVTAGQVVTLAQLQAGQLVYTPATGASGNNALTITFTVNDGATFAASSSTFTLNIVPPVKPINRDLDNSRTSSDLFAGTSFDDKIGGSGGNDSIGGGLGNDTLIGGAGNDFLSGGNGNDVVYAGAGDNGNDVIHGNAGNDTLGGGAGNDTIAGGDINFTASILNNGDLGSDVIFGGAGNDLLVGGSYNSALKTVINTGTGSNEIYGGAGDDTVYGDNGTDILGGGEGNDVINGAKGNDTVYAGAGNDTVNAGDGDDSVFAGAGNDNLDGGAGNDTLFSGAGNDTVAGGAGNDQIWAGAGNDDLSGGAGADVFVFGAKSGNDRVLDFNTGEDKLDLSNATANFADFAAVLAAAEDTTQGGQSGVLINLGGDQSVFIVGITESQLTSTNVIV